jgi:hypothetical protein
MGYWAIAHLAVNPNQEGVERKKHMRDAKQAELAK